MSEQQENQPLLFMDLYYIGKLFNKNVQKRDGTVSKSYKYMFKRNMDTDQYSINFWGFDTTKGVDTLVEGDMTRIGYVEIPNRQGDKPLKGARFFGKSEAKEPTPKPAPQKQDFNNKNASAIVNTPAEVIPEQWILMPEFAQFVDDAARNGDGFISAFGEKYSAEFVDWIRNPDEINMAKTYYDMFTNQGKSAEYMDWFFKGLFDYIINRIKENKQ